MTRILTDLTAVLTTTPPRWNQLTQTFPEDLLRRQPLPGEWSALECLQHFIDTERSVFLPRVEALLTGKDSFPGYFPDESGTPLSDSVAPADLAAEFAALRTENLKLVERITPADLDRQTTHAELGVVSLSELLHEWGGHDLMHLVQAEQALMQPFIDGCGAWQPYFVKHAASINPT
jgi:hypothetical protein